MGLFTSILHVAGITVEPDEPRRAFDACDDEDGLPRAHRPGPHGALHPTTGLLLDEHGFDSAGNGLGYDGHDSDGPGFDFAPLSSGLDDF